MGRTASAVPGHPRLYFTAESLAALRAQRNEGAHALIWRNLAESAEWCLARPLRAAWIAPVAPDPIYLNLYDRFYAMMHDMAVMEHLAFAYAYSGESRYFEGARAWTLTCSRIWQREADGEPDASKAYAVMRLLKGLAVGYDLLYAGLTDAERAEIRETLAQVGRKYYHWYLQNPMMGTVAQGKHHASVETASFGIVALALLGEIPEAADWLELMVRKHVESLLPGALTPSGTSDEGGTFYTSTMQYRLMFLDPLRRVTGTDLFARFAPQLSGRLALAKIASGREPGWPEVNQSVLFEPCYGQLDYWSPVLLCLAREYRRPEYQRLALWDRTLGAITKSRFITPNGEMLLFEFAGYAYAWYDPTVGTEVAQDVPRDFAFPETCELYARAGYEPGGLLAGCKDGLAILHAGGRPVLIEQGEASPELTPELVDDGETAGLVMRDQTQAPALTIRLQRPNCCVLTRLTDSDARWWCHGTPERDGNTLTWPNGTRLRVTRGAFTALNPAGFRDEKIVGMGLLACVDPMPMAYLAVTARPEGGVLTVEVVTPPVQGDG